MTRPIPSSAYLAALVLLLPACSTPAERRDAGAAEPLAYSLLGRALYPLEFTEERRTELEADLAKAYADWQLNPTDVDTIIWYGRRLAYLGRYDEAIDVYSEGLRLHPSSAKLLRHRGHRHITLRRFRLAILDLDRARALTIGGPDEVEPDGQPNALGVPTSTLKTNIWYHLGLAYFLEKGNNYPMALRTYREGLELSRINSDMFCANAYWLFLTLRRTGYRREAADLLDAISADMTILENHAYHRLLLLYKGDLALEDLLGDEKDGVQSATLGYGIASYHLNREEFGEAAIALQTVVEGDAWPAFGFLAAETDLVRLGPFLFTGR